MSNYIDNIVKNAVTYDLVSKPLADDMANEFSIQSTYAVGDYVMHDYKLYKCISAITTAGNWNSAKWQECKIGDEINGGVKFTAQTLTSEQKAQARNNIGAVSQEEATPDAVRYSAQSLTDAQKNQARVNVGTVASTSIAEEFSTSKAYAVGDMVMYDSKLYKFKTAHSAGAWNNAQVDAVSVKEEISSLSNDLSESVKFVPQTLTDAQKEQAKTNLGISGVSGDSVRFDIDQSKTDAEKTRARNNIDANQKVFVDSETYAQGDTSGFYAYRNNTLQILGNVNFKCKKISVESWMKQVSFSINTFDGISEDVIFCGFSDGNNTYISMQSRDAGNQKMNIPQNAAYILFTYFIGTPTGKYNSEYTVYGDELSSDNISHIVQADNVRYSVQNLTDEQQKQARVNIGANYFTFNSGEVIDTASLSKQANKYWGNGGLNTISSSSSAYNSGFYALTNLIDVEPGNLVTLYDYGLCSLTDNNSAAFGLYNISGNDVPGRCNFNDSTVVSITKEAITSTMGIVSKMEIRIPNNVYKIGLHYVTKIDGTKMFTGIPKYKISNGQDIEIDENVRSAIETMISENTTEILYDGLTGVAFGTSLTYRSQTTGGYLQYLPTLSGITFDNQGLGSSTILPSGSLPQMMPIITSYSGYSGKRVCLLEGFVNDWYNNGEYLGTWKDTGQTTVCGCVRHAISHILTQNPSITLFLVLDHFGKGITASNALNAANQTQFEFYQEIEKVALSMGVRVIREYEVSEISELTPQYLLDNIHMNDLGAKQSANAIWSEMKKTYPNVISS